MRAAVSGLACFQPKNLGEALVMMHSEGDLVPLAGCTDVFVELNLGKVQGEKFVDLWPLQELKNIEMRGDKLAIGALATYADVLKSPLVRQRLPILAEAAATIGGAQIQNRGTIGGNLGNASPAGDTLPAFAVAEAEIVLHSAAGERRLPFGEFFVGYKKTARRPDELIVAVEVPPLEGEQRFRKIGTRAANAVSKVVLAGILGERPRFAAGSVAPTVVRLEAAERALAEGKGTAGAVAALQQDIAPIDDLRSTAVYRRKVAAHVLATFLAERA